MTGLFYLACVLCAGCFVRGYFVLGYFDRLSGLARYVKPGETCNLNFINYHKESRMGLERAFVGSIQLRNYVDE